MLKLFSILGVWFFGNASWILASVNFLWMLFKDTSLFSWWIVIASSVLFVISLVMFFYDLGK